MGIAVLLGTLVALVVILLLIGVILPSGDSNKTKDKQEDEVEGFEE